MHAIRMKTSTRRADLQGAGGEFAEQQVGSGSDERSWDEAKETPRQNGVTKNTCERDVASSLKHNCTPNSNLRAPRLHRPPTRFELSTTAHFKSASQALSSRALEKQAVRIDNVHNNHQLTQGRSSANQEDVTAIPHPAHLPSRPATIRPRSQRKYRTSFLTTFLARQQNKELQGASSAATSSRVANPINYIPRPTPVHFPHQDTVDEDTAPERRSLLTLPEQRQSRNNSPSLSNFQDTFVIDGEDSQRTSIGLPSNHRPGAQILEYRSSMAQDREKPFPPGPPMAEKEYKAPTRQNTKDGDLQANLPTKLGSNYGFSEQDRPTQPPRRVSSQRSISHARSLGSMHSASYTRADPSAPPPLPHTIPPQQQSQPQAQAQSQSQSKQMMPTQPSYPQSHDLERGPDPTDHPSSHNEYPEPVEEPSWGPSHPCFPHLNPHVPLHSPLYNSTRIIRIRRDWMIVGDLAPCYSNIYPEILDPLLPEQEFRYMIRHINKVLISAFDPFRVANWLDGVLGLLTGWFWEDFRPGGVKRELKALEAWIEEWNRTVGAPDGVKLITLRRTGYLCLDIQIPDPQVRVIESDGEGEQDGDGRSHATPRPNMTG